ncbi:4790_t:CDS:2 [Cetraspora pellucida]|uniref:4790_t:CDS:1 n=1 Tax=Cetraspora pellucida TaxID=1433469 RepID=A0ACA9M4L8_9GLOM|nr:4790_t:CDS:2 [Cetraspora pellucida]
MNKYLLNTKQFGEALELLSNLDDNSVSLIFLDPQYEKVGTVLKLDYPLFYTSDYQILRILEQIERKFPYDSKVFKDRSFGNVWEESQLASNKRDHPHQKPRELIKALITATTQEGDLIVDPCAGSFVVLDACQELKREFIDLVYKFCEEKGIKNNSFEVQEQGLFYLGKRRIYFFDLFSFRKARGKIARGTTFQEIVYEEAIPIDQEILPREQWKLKDFIESLKRNSDSPLKITFLANPYYFSMYFLDNFPHLQSLRKEAEELKRKGDNDGIKAVSPDKQ